MKQFQSTENPCPGFDLSNISLCGIQMKFCLHAKISDPESNKPEEVDVKSEEPMPAPDTGEPPLAVQQT